MNNNVMIGAVKSPASNKVDYLWNGTDWIKSTEPGIKPITLDLPTGFKKFKFYSQKDKNNGYYSIYESQSGILIVNQFSKKLSDTKDRAEYMIKTYTKNPSDFQKLIDKQKNRVTAVVKEAFNKPKPGSKKFNPKLDALRKAKDPGKRVSRSRNIYYEYRVNRSDQKGKKI